MMKRKKLIERRSTSLTHHQVSTFINEKMLLFFFFITLLTVLVSKQWLYIINDEITCAVFSMNEISAGNFQYESRDILKGQCN